MQRPVSQFTVSTRAKVIVAAALVFIAIGVAGLLRHANKVSTSSHGEKKAPLALFPETASDPETAPESGHGEIDATRILHLVAASEENKENRELRSKLIDLLDDVVSGPHADALFADLMELGADDYTLYLFLFRWASVAPKKVAGHLETLSHSEMRYRSLSQSVFKGFITVGKLQEADMFMRDQLTVQELKHAAPDLLEGYTNAGNLESAFELWRDFPSNQELTRMLGEAIGRRDIDEAVAWASELAGSEKSKAISGLLRAIPSYEAGVSLLDRVTDSDVEEALIKNLVDRESSTLTPKEALSRAEFLASRVDNDAFKLMLQRGAFLSVAERQPHQAAEYLLSGADSLRTDRGVITQVAKSLTFKQPQEALNWSLSIPDEKLSHAALKTTLRNWMTLDLNAAQEAVAAMNKGDSRRYAARVVGEALQRRGHLEAADAWLKLAD